MKTILAVLPNCTQKTCTGGKIMILREKKTFERRGLENREQIEPCRCLVLFNLN